MLPIKKRFYNLKTTVADRRIDNSNTSGGSISDSKTGDGEAWHNKSDKTNSGWFRKRLIKAGQWFGWWIRIKNSEVE